MGFFWIFLYGLTYTVSHYISGLFHPPISLPALAMVLYIVLLLIWLIRTGYGRKIGLYVPVQITAIDLAAMLPLLTLPICNLLNAKQPQETWSTLVILTCAAIAEELFFRGWLLSCLSSRPITAICLPGTIFALLHAVNIHSATSFYSVLLQMLIAFCFSLSCGAVTLRCKSLIPAVCVHIFVNLTGASSVLSFHAIAICTIIYILHGVLLCKNLCLEHKEKQP